MRTIILNCIAGPLKGETFTLLGGPVFLFGRYPKVDFSLAADPAASHLHFLIDTSDNRIRIIDLGSTNGLVINDRHMGGKKGTPFTDFVKLKSGDTILAGACLFRLSVHDSVPDTGFQPGRTPGNGNGGASWQASSRPNGKGVVGGASLPGSSVPQPQFGNPTQYQEDGLPAIPGFTLIEKIGESQKVFVYRAVKDDSGAAAAIKLLALSGADTFRAMESLQREIDIMKKLDHPNIIRYIADGITGMVPFLAVEYVSGGSLEELVAASPDARMNVPQAVPLFIQLLEAAAYLHGLGLVHRNIKPKNILMDLRRAGSMAAKLSNMWLTSSITIGDPVDYSPVLGEGESPAYMPPEQLTNPGRAIPQTDVYSAAATFYFMMTGKTLYNISGKNITDTVVEGVVAPIGQLRPDLSVNLTGVIDKALSFSTEDRYADAHQFLDAFRRALS